MQTITTTITLSEVQAVALGMHEYDELEIVCEVECIDHSFFYDYGSIVNAFKKDVEWQVRCVSHKYIELTSDQEEDIIMKARENTRD